MKRCLVCDDHALMREAMIGLVQDRWSAAKIDEAADFPAAWTLAALEPDLCLVDLSMPGADLRSGIAGVMARAPGAQVVAVTGTGGDDLLIDLLAMGVAGFLPKTMSGAAMLAAIELVLAGGRYLPPRVAELLLARVRLSPPPVVRAAGSLTPRQRQVLDLVARGLSNKEIAKTLGLSPATIKTHVSQAIAIVGGTNRTDAAIRALPHETGP